MPFTYRTDTPPPPTEQEIAEYFFGRCGLQHARKNKKTGKIEVWWTGDEGHWGLSFHYAPKFFICKPRLSHG